MVVEMALSFVDHFGNADYFTIDMQGNGKDIVNFLTAGLGVFPGNISKG